MSRLDHHGMCSAGASDVFERRRPVHAAPSLIDAQASCAGSEDYRAVLRVKRVRRFAPTGEPAPALIERAVLTSARNVQRYACVGAVEAVALPFAQRRKRGTAPRRAIHAS